MSGPIGAKELRRIIKVHTLQRELPEDSGAQEGAALDNLRRWSRAKPIEHVMNSAVRALGGLADRFQELSHRVEIDCSGAVVAVEE